MTDQNLKTAMTVVDEQELQENLTQAAATMTQATPMSTQERQDTHAGVVKTMRDATGQMMSDEAMRNEECLKRTNAEIETYERYSEAVAERLAQLKIMKSSLEVQRDVLSAHTATPKPRKVKAK